MKTKTMIYVAIGAALAGYIGYKVYRKNKEKKYQDCLAANMKYVQEHDGKGSGIDCSAIKPSWIK